MLSRKTNNFPPTILKQFMEEELKALPYHCDLQLLSPSYSASGILFVV